ASHRFCFWSQTRCARPLTLIDRGSISVHRFLPRQKSREEYTMSFFVGRDREARRAYGFDEIALVPGAVTVNPEEVEISISIGNVKIEVPFLASAMDGVVS